MYKIFCYLFGNKSIYIINVSFNKTMQVLLYFHKYKYADVYVEL